VKRRRATSRNPAKAKQTIKAKPGAASKAERNRRLCKDTDAPRLARERDDAVVQLSATSDILKVICSSPGDLQAVFAAILENAVRLCEAKFGTLYLHEGGALRMAAGHNVPTAYVEARRRCGSYHPHAGAPFGEVVRTKQTVHVADVAASQAYAERHPAMVEAVEIAGIRTQVAVPMLKEDDLIGAITIYRTEVRTFTDKQVALLTNFAAQAVIAIENARLLNELRESLEQQTATSAVLSVISTSPGELEPVFRAIVENAVKLCEAKFGHLLRFDGKEFRVAAGFDTPPELAEFQTRRGPYQPTPGTLMDRVMRTKQVSHSADYAAEPTPGGPAKFGGARSTVVVPMLKDDVLIGAITIYRQEVRPFTDRQIALVQNFAAQAVIAIENTRLLNELRESLQQQTATAEVLKVISSSPGDLEPVFQAMLENATRLCEANFGIMYRYDGDAFHLAATLNLPPALADFLQQRGPVRAEPGLPLYHLLQTRSAFPKFESYHAALSSL
jgi:GAF domain-containing protein